MFFTFLFYLIGSFLPAYPMRHFTVPSGSMVPAVQIHDHLLVDTGAYKDGKMPKRGDIVVLKRDEYYLVKRVVGISGDRIEFSPQGFLQLNGVAVSVREVHLAPNTFSEYPGSTDFFEETLGGKTYLISLFKGITRIDYPAATVASDMVYVAGDCRDNSKDSRHFGLVPTSDLVGRVKYIFAFSWARGFTKLPE